MINLKIFISLILSTSWTLVGLSQTPDTLDAQGYFPLAVGNVWEYQHHLIRPATPTRPTDQSETRFERYEITNNEIQGATNVFELTYSERDESLDLIRSETLLVQFDESSSSITGTHLVGILNFLTCLDSAFSPSEPLDDGCRPFVSNTTAVFPRLFGVEEVFVKNLSSFVWTTQLVHTVGLVHAGGGCEPCGPLDDRDEWSLAFASVSGKIFGASIVATERPSLHAEQRLEIYPNPASSWITVETDSRESVQLFDITGKRIIYIQSATNHRTLDLRQLPAGIYFIVVGKKTRSFILQ